MSIVGGLVERERPRRSTPTVWPRTRSATSGSAGGATAVADSYIVVLTVAAADVQPSPAWGLDRVDQPALPLNKEHTFPNAGVGVHVHVLDTGIRTTHQEFGGRAKSVPDADTCRSITPA